MLPLQLLLFPSLPLFLVDSADLDKSFFLHAHNTCINVTLSSTSAVFAEMRSFTFCVSMVSTCRPFGNLVQVRQIINFSCKSNTITTIITCGHSLPVQGLIDQLSLKPGGQHNVFIGT